MNNKNIIYEKLVAQIHQGMLKYDGFENLRVEHDVTLTGKSGATHQIDVFWEFKAAGMIYRTCVECKNYNSAVKKLHVAAFSSVLNDIGNANGIIATTSSFQKGAKLLAEQNNIRLVLVNHLINKIHITGNLRYPLIDNIGINFNQKSLKKALKKNNLNMYTYDLVLHPDHPLFDIKGNEVETFNSLIRKFPGKEGYNIIDNIAFYFEFDDIGHVLIDSIYFDVSYRELDPMEIIVESPNKATAVIKDIVNNNLHFLNNDGTVTKKVTHE